MDSIQDSEIGRGASEIKRLLIVSCEPPVLPRIGSVQGSAKSLRLGIKYKYQEYTEKSKALLSFNSILITMIEPSLGRTEQYPPMLARLLHS